MFAQGLKEKFYDLFALLISSIDFYAAGHLGGENVNEISS